MDSLESIVKSIRQHISKIQDNLLFDEFIEEFDIDNLVEPVDSYTSIQDLFIRGIKVSDRTFAYKFWWVARDYNEKSKRYGLESKRVVLIDKQIEDALDSRINELDKLGLNDWRKSNLDSYYQHYWWHINNLRDIITNNRVRTSIFTVNNTLIRNVLDITYSRKFQLMIIDYIIKNKITSHSRLQEEISFFDPITNDITRTISSSSNVGGMRYLVYLTYNEILELIDSVRSDVFKKDGISDVRSFLRNSSNDYKFYLYFNVGKYA